MAKKKIGIQQAVSIIADFVKGGLSERESCRKLLTKNNVTYTSQGGFEASYGIGAIRKKYLELNKAN
jgi:hypothetical protein